MRLRSGAGRVSRPLNRWRGSQSFTPSHSSRRVVRECNEAGVAKLFYDAGGVGAGVRGPMMEMAPAFSVTGCNFGGKVQLPDVPFISRGVGGLHTNDQYFANWASQAGWVVRLRANNTVRLLDGEKIDPEFCLFINPDIPELRDVLAQLAQPEWDDSSGKLRIDKQPREPGEAKPPSPDAYDGTILAYSPDAGSRVMSRLMARVEG